LSFSLPRSLRRFKPSRRTARIIRRPDEELPFVFERAASGPELLLDTCVYIDVLQSRAPQGVKNLLKARLSNHSGVALAELTYLFGRLDPRHMDTGRVLAEISELISNMPKHRLTAPSISVQGKAGVLAGLVARLSGNQSGREQALLNDATLYLQAVEQGQTVLTRNVREFDWFDQLLPSDRILFYRQT
jgi:predicted nucleic acid-binding protein